MLVEKLGTFSDEENISYLANSELDKVIIIIRNLRLNWIQVVANLSEEKKTQNLFSSK